MAKESTLDKQRIKAMKEGRDKKAHEHFVQYAPVWLVAEEPLLNRDTLYFNVVFQHPQYGWVNRHYAYDVVTDVLYHKGQQSIDEETALDIQTKDPYIKAAGFNSVQAYGG
ncbi:MAG: hypothetical protein HY862_16870 [Chloroflexi bacterium]|nr:hypothetical protein [Chloroflexota bacterium]